MCSYITKSWWREKDTSKLPSYKEITGEDEPVQPDVDEDERILDKTDAFEEELNFKHEREAGGPSKVGCGLVLSLSLSLRA